MYKSYHEFPQIYLAAYTLDIEHFSHLCLFPPPPQALLPAPWSSFAGYRTLYKWNHAVFVFTGLLLLILHSILQIQVCSIW